jgi:hypothetical protein
VSAPDWAQKDGTPARSPQPWALVPIPFAVWRIAYLFSINADQMDPDQLVMPLAVAVVAAVVVFALGRLALGNAPAAGAFAALVMMLFFEYGQLSDALGDALGIWVGPDFSTDTVLDIVLIAGVALFAWLLRSGRLPSYPVGRFAGILGAALLAVGVFSAVSAYVRHADNAGPRSSTALDIELADVGADELPDIYYVVLDRYLAAPELADALDFDNGDFLGFLRSRGFHVADDARSNYAVTYMSLASSLNMRYIDDLTDDPAYPPSAGQGVPRDREPFYDAIDDSRLVRVLHEHGYRYVHFDSGWGATADTDTADLVVRPDSSTEFTDILIATSVLHRLPAFDVQHTWYRRILNTFEQLGDVEPASEPTFAFAHIVTPHPPFVFEADGTLRTESTNEAVAGSEDGNVAPIYLDQLTYVNELLEGLVDELIAEEDRPRVIVLQSDHGAAYHLGDDAGDEATRRVRAHSILYAVRTPDGAPDGFDAQMTPVNTFRILLTDLGLVEKGELPVLPRRAFSHAGGSWPYWPPEVTDVVIDTTASPAPQGAGGSGS